MRALARKRWCGQVINPYHQHVHIAHASMHISRDILELLLPHNNQKQFIRVPLIIFVLVSQVF